MSTQKILTAAIVALVLLSWGVVAAPPAPQNSTQTSPSAGPESIVVKRCQVIWEDDRTISSKIQGRIKERKVKDGDLVEEEQELALLDDSEARLEFKRQDMLGNSELDEKTSYLKWVEYLARFDAASRLVNSRAIPLEEWRLAKVNVEVNDLLTQKEVEKRQIEKIKANQSKLILEEHVIRSPIRGIIQKCFKREMELVTPSDHQMFRIVATDKVWVEGWADIRDVYRVKLEQAVEVKLALFEAERTPLDSSEEKRSPVSPGQPSTSSRPAPGGERSKEQRVKLPQEEIPFPGTITYIDPNVDFSARAFKVRALVANKYDKETNLPILRAGMNANMTIKLEDKPSSEKNGDPKN